MRRHRTGRAYGWDHGRGDDAWRRPFGSRCQGLRYAVEAQRRRWPRCRRPVAAQQVLPGRLVPARSARMSRSRVLRRRAPVGARQAGHRRTPRRQGRPLGVMSAVARRPYAWLYRRRLRSRHDPGSARRRVRLGHPRPRCNQYIMSRAKTLRPAPECPTPAPDRDRASGSAYLRLRSLLPAIPRRLGVVVEGLVVDDSIASTCFQRSGARGLARVAAPPRETGAAVADARSRRRAPRRQVRVRRRRRTLGLQGQGCGRGWDPASHSSCRRPMIATGSCRIFYSVDSGLRDLVSPGSTSAG